MARGKSPRVTETNGGQLGVESGHNRTYPSVERPSAGRRVLQADGGPCKTLGEPRGAVAAEL